MQIVPPTIGHSRKEQPKSEKSPPPKICLPKVRNPYGKLRVKGRRSRIRAQIVDFVDFLGPGSQVLRDRKTRVPKKRAAFTLGGSPFKKVFCDGYRPVNTALIADCSRIQVLRDRKTRAPKKRAAFTLGGSPFKKVVFAMVIVQ